jgi:hypothetical protein
MIRDLLQLLHDTGLALPATLVAATCFVLGATFGMVAVSAVMP